MPQNERIPTLYQEYVENIPDHILPPEWTIQNLDKFSKNKSLFKYQIEALTNILKLLYDYYSMTVPYSKNETEETNLNRKQEFYNKIERMNERWIKPLEITNKKNKPLFDKLKEFYQIEEKRNYEKIHFYNFINRASFWMATGSGKTIVIIKLVEILNSLINSNQIPDNDIVILTQRDDLIEQIKEHIEEYNSNNSKKIKVWDLKKYEEVKSGRESVNKNDINIFIYRSDLVGDEETVSKKEAGKRIDYETIENDGKWYLILDEAHKGDKSDSKRQMYYSIMSRNGFLFNFSASFTDDWDILTTVYNFNLPEFITKGYGKQIFISTQDLSAFGRDKKDFDNEEKKKIVLKTLILLTYLKKIKESIDDKTRDLGLQTYHNPMLISLVNSVNTKESDLEMFFKVLEDIAKGELSNEIILNAKDELRNEFITNPKYYIGNGTIHMDIEELSNINLNDVLKYIFNASSKGSIEVIKLPQNKEELIFKLKTSDKPFALIKIGDISTWLRDKLTHYDIIESYDSESYFENLNKNDNINILMGSRAFYEGWDSNRPNIMIFINIGKGDAKKYVIQSIGRGVRIEPVKGKRKRLNKLYHEDETIERIYESLDNKLICPIETLFVYGTNKKNIEAVLEGMKSEKKTLGETIELMKNNGKIEHIGGEIELLVPVYKDTSKKYNINELPKFEGNKELLQKYIEWLSDDRLLYALLSEYNDDIDANTIARLKEYIKNGEFEENNNSSSGRHILYQLNGLIKHINIVPKEFDKFESVHDRIVHFNRINVFLDDDEVEELKKCIEDVKGYGNIDRAKEKYKEELRSGIIDVDQYTKKIERLTDTVKKEKQFKDLKIKYIAEHYYVPVIIAENEKNNYINHIVKVESERKFIEKLEEYLKKGGEFFKHFDWWMFSKIDEHLDDVGIPYYYAKYNKIREYKPDFIFWLKKGNDYYILFIDPKGFEHSDYNWKIRGYKDIFENKNGGIRTFRYKDYNVKIYLALYTVDRNKVPPACRKYWIDDFDRLMNDWDII
ncbi:MAG: type restriction enzyme [Methanothermococcus sp.]|jgi:hypothetical protein|uniref:DEAD/DEAH box helicase family protein n=1 Tax=Methanothermococcus TaxID=155862 RepID=UPI00035F8A95|nr:MULTISPECIES: DEAD/DEAH box helicase family protein [Methanothermococcus]MDK2789509.1 type restriction enzyme [Methanothermococcus sp.]MDK2987448.1 type restriction enzyme [Methanothermococcus sp.]